MRHRTGRRKMLLAFDVLDRWSYMRSLKRKARAESGWTSVRISKATARALHQLAADVAAANGDHYHYHTPPLAELLEWLASGTAIRPDRELARACNSAIAKSSRRPRVHASHLDGSRRTA